MFEEIFRRTDPNSPRPASRRRRLVRYRRLGLLRSFGVVYLMLRGLLLIVIGLLASVRACSINNPCATDQFCNFDDDNSGSCERCRDSCGTNCFACGLPRGGVQDCIARCPEHQVFCFAACTRPCNELSDGTNIPYECGNCSTNYACRPGAEGFYRDQEENGAPPYVGLAFVVFIFMVGFKLKARSRRGRANAQQLRQAQEQEQNNRGRQQQLPAQTSLPVAVAQATPMTMIPMQIVLPPDAHPGQSIQVNVQGQMMAVTVPPDARPGGSMIIQVPSGSPMVTATAQVVQMVQPGVGSNPPVMMGIPI